MPPYSVCMCYQLGHLLLLPLLVCPKGDIYRKSSLYATNTSFHVKEILRIPSLIDTDNVHSYPDEEALTEGRKRRVKVPIRSCSFHWTVPMRKRGNKGGGVALGRGPCRQRCLLSPRRAVWQYQTR